MFLLFIYDFICNQKLNDTQFKVFLSTPNYGVLMQDYWQLQMPINKIFKLICFYLAVVDTFVNV